MRKPFVDASVRALREEGDERAFLGTLFSTGKTFEANDTHAMAEWLFSAAVRPGHVSMPKEIMPSAGDRMTLDHQLRQLWQAIGVEE